MAGSYEPAIAASVIEVFFEYREELGWLCRWWRDYSARVGTGSSPKEGHGNGGGGYYIQNFDNGDWGSCALVYNPAKDKTYTLQWRFWNVFRYGIGDGSAGDRPSSVAGNRSESDGIFWLRGGSFYQRDWDGSYVHIYTREDGT